MDNDWLADGRKIPDEVMYYIRRMAVNSVRKLGQSPEVVAKVFNFNRACIYRWLKQYDEGGFSALKSEMAPGAAPLITGEMDVWLKLTVLEKTPISFGYDTNLWTCAILAELLNKMFDVTVSDCTVRLHLKNLGLTFQKPEYQDEEKDKDDIEYFLNVKYPKIQRLASRIGADIGFQDESGVGIMTRYGRTWGLRGKTPVVNVSMKRGGYNVMSIITAQGEMRYSVQDGSINGKVFIDFLNQLIQARERPLILLVDHASFHKSKLVRDFVRAHRTKLRIFFLPKRAPEYNPDEHVWNEIKTHGIGKQPVKNKQDLKDRLFSCLASLQKNAKKIVSFFQYPATRYAS
jgi:transposase